MKSEDVIRVRVDGDFKGRCMRMCSARGTSVSEMVRTLLEDELATFEDPLAALDAVALSAERKVGASGLGEPSVDDLVSYVDEVREQRAKHMLVAS